MASSLSIYRTLFFFCILLWIGSQSIFSAIANDSDEDVVWSPGYFSIGGGFCQRQELVKYFKVVEGVRRGPFLKTKLYYLNSRNDDCSEGHVFEYLPSSSIVSPETLEFYLSLLESEKLTVASEECLFSREDIIRVIYNEQRVGGLGKVLTIEHGEGKCDLFARSTGHDSNEVTFTLAKVQEN